jgi:G3E family GTPase
MDEPVRNTFYIDNVIALVDAVHCIEKLDESRDQAIGTAAAQIAFSSTVLLNKTDLVDEARIVECENRLKRVNRLVDVIRCQQARVPLERLFHVKAFDLERVLDEYQMDEDEFNRFYQPQMDRSISNVGVKFQGPVAMAKLQSFLNTLIGEEESAKDFFRIKGVLDIAGHPNMFVLQCVHMLRNQNFTKPWPAGPRENRIIFIGRGMEERRQALIEGIRDCVAGPLRFAVGARVFARTGETTYTGGTILRQWDELNAYRIRLDDGGEVHAPICDDKFVKGRET